MPILFDSGKRVEAYNTATEADSFEIADEAINYNAAIIDSMKASYESAKCHNLGIINEGFTDMMVRLKEWFINWLDHFRLHITNYFMKIQKHLRMLVVKATKTVSYRGKIKTGFTVKGFEYNLEGKLNNWCINDIISRIESATNAVENAGADVGQVLVKELANVGSIELFDKYRGNLLGKNYIMQREFNDELDRFFRNGSERKKDISITERYVDNIYDESKHLRRILADLQKERAMLESNVNGILSFLNKRPAFLAEQNKENKIYREKVVSATEVNNAITAIYARSASSLKTTLLICEQFFNRKIIAVNEALRFYNSIMSQALGSANETVKESTSITEGTYFEMLEEELSYLQDEYESDMIDEATLELFVYTEAWEAKQEAITMEEANGRVVVGANDKPVTQRRVRGFGNRIADLVRRFIQFIGNILSKFDQALGDILKTDIEWLRANSHFITDMPAEVLNTLTLNYSNYMHTQAHQRILEKKLPDGANLANIIDHIGRGAVNARMNKNQSYNAANECYRQFFPTLVRIDPTNWKVAATMYYRGYGRNIPKSIKMNSGQAETVTAKGQQCAQVLSEMMKYCLNYKQYAQSAENTVSTIKNAIAAQQKTIEKVMQTKSELNSGPTNEGFEPYSLLEDVYLVNEELGASSAGAGNNANAGGTVSNAGPAAGPSGISKGAPPKKEPAPVNNLKNTVGNKNALNKDQKQAAAEKEVKEKALKRTNEVLDTTSYAAEQIKTAFTVCVSIGTAKLTVCEEIHKSYMRVLHGVVDAVRKYNGNAEEDRENAQYNKEQEDRAEAEHQAKRQDIKRRNQLRADRRTGLYGKMKNFFAGA